MKSKLFLDIHALQVVPPSCLNRDDVGAPKVATYGGVQRARVSSQSWKRAIRTGFRGGLSSDELSYRTKQVIDIITAEVLKLSSEISDDDAKKLVTEALVATKIIKGKDTDNDKGKGKGKKKKVDEDAVNEEAVVDADSDEQKTMFFISAHQVKDFAALLVGIVGTDKKPSDIKKDLTDALKNNNGLEIVLFGRMSASESALDVDACVQVAHAISTHEVESELDFFTAVDDAKTGGAGHLGDSEFNSSMLYRYGSLAIHELDAYITDKEKTAKIVKDFIEHFVVSMPTGKINSYANNTIPSVLYVTIREDRALNVCPAFEKAIPASPEGYLVPSAKALEDYTLDAYADFVKAPVKSYVVGKHLPKLAGQDGRVSLSTLLESVEDYVRGLE